MNLSELYSKVSELGFFPSGKLGLEKKISPFIEKFKFKVNIKELHFPPESITCKNCPQNIKR